MSQEQQKETNDELVWRMRVEKKLDDISTALVTLARVEERLTMLEERRHEFSDSLEKVNERFAAVLERTTKNTEQITFLNRVMWGLIGGVGALALSQLSQFM